MPPKCADPSAPQSARWQIPDNLLVQEPDIFKSGQGQPLLNIRKMPRKDLDIIAKALDINSEGSTNEELANDIREHFLEQADIALEDKLNNVIVINLHH